MRTHGFFSVCLVGLAALLPACSADAPDSVAATEVFADCLERNDVQADGLEVTLDPDGSIATISLQIVSEGEVAYEPTIRLACTAEVEAGS